VTGVPAVFFDRDGVLNRAILREGRPYPPERLEDMEIIPGTAASLPRLIDAGYLLIGITNQPDVARGTQTQEIVESLNAFVQSALPLREIFVCYHDGDRCDCRKPKPGLLLQAAVKYRLDMAACYLIGDRWRDIDAGRAAGCKTVWIDRRYAEQAPAQPPDVRVES